MKKQTRAERLPVEAKRLRERYLDTDPPLEKSIPAGPFEKGVQKAQGDLLLFVPRNEVSRTINSLTGRYGYSHLAIDCGEIDVPTGRRVMIEATMGPGVHQAFQDEYGKRPFIRIPLRDVGVDVNAFCACVHARLGEKFDDLEAITLGILDNPARQICSDLATVCLPEDLRQKIARYHRKAVIHPLSAVRGSGGDRFRLFMSPNGFAEFLGAPRGRTLQSPDQRVIPHLQDEHEGLLSRLWRIADTIVTSAWKTLKKHPG